MRSGELLVDRYELGDRLGVGGMSTVVGAFDRRLERHVAVKLLAEHLADDRQFVERFRREALAAARLVHPNIVQVFDFGLDEKTHRQYIVMELVDGQSGAEILKDEGRMDLGDALSMVTQACAGLEYAHRNGVVHRDVKPGNLLRSGDGVVKLADFGIAKAMSDESAITQIGSVLGTAAYLAPEQAAGEPAGPAADIYALGVVAYQLISGRLPYDANSLTELALKQQREMPPALHEIAPGVSPQLSAAVDTALALDPRERFASADAMRAALEAGAGGAGPATSATRVAGATAPDTDATSVLGGTAATSAAGRSAAPRQPRQPRPPREARATPPPAAAPARRSRERPAAAPRRKPRSGLRQTLGMFLVLVLLAAGGAAAVIATSGSTDAVNLRQVVYDNVQQGVDALKGLVQDNTR